MVLLQQVQVLLILQRHAIMNKALPAAE